MHRYAEKSNLPTPKYGTNGDRNALNQAGCYKDLSNSSINKAPDIYASYDATRFAINKT